jgi:predicted TIM-barrel fold metal-dependent hydrolase
MGAHLGSLEWSLDEMASHFDMFPNMSVDMAARISHVENHARNDWQKVHDFFIKYQDRIIYGTDQGDWRGAEADPAIFKAGIHEVWMHDWAFMTTDSTMTAPEVNGSFKGLELPREVIEKIYYKNALKWFPGV